MSYPVHGQVVLNFCNFVNFAVSLFWGFKGDLFFSVKISEQIL